jgi:hypothetical protein
VHTSTGLPVAVVSVPPALEERQRHFIAAHNAEILRAREAGDIEVDLLPALRPRGGSDALFRAGSHHVLAPKRPIDLVGGEVRYEVFVPRPPKTPPKFRPPGERYVRRIDENGRHYVMSYLGAPIPVVVHPKEETIAFQMEDEWTVFHVRTGAELKQVRGRR